MSVTSDRKEEIYELLRERYRSRGCHDFYFKSKHVAGRMGLDIRTVGKILTMLYREGKLGIWNRLSGCHVYTFVTRFNNGEGD